METTLTTAGSYMNKEAYRLYKEKWANRVYALWFGDLKGQEGLLLHRSTVSLPDYIRGTAKKTIIPAGEISSYLHDPAYAGQCLLRLVKYTLSNTQWGPIKYYRFADDPEHKIINLDDYPLPGYKEPK